MATRNLVLIVLMIALGVIVLLIVMKLRGAALG